MGFTENAMGINKIPLTCILEGMKFINDLIKL
jgi:hypothetical protein